MGLFDRKTTPTPPAVPEVKTSDKAMLNSLDNTRSMSMLILNTLRSIDFDDLAAKKAFQDMTVTTFVKDSKTEIPAVQFINDVKGTISVLKNKMKNEAPAQLLKIDSKQFDNQIYYLAEHLKNALESGDFDTAKCCMLGLNYGIIHAHKPILEKDRTRKEQEIANREKKIGVYENIVAKSEEVFKRYAQLLNFRKHYQRVFNEYKEVHEEMLREKRRRPDIYEKIKGMTTRDTKILGDEEMKAWKLALKHNNLYHEAKQVEVIGEHIALLIDQHKRMISNLKTSANSIGYDIDKKLEQEIDKNLKEITKALNDDQEAINNGQEKLDKLQADFITAMKNAKIQEDMIRRIRESEQIEQEVQERIDNDKAGEANLKNYDKEQAIKEAQEIQARHEQKKNENKQKSANSHKGMLNNY